MPQPPSEPRIGPQTGLLNALKSIATERDIEEWWRKINTPLSDIGSKVGRWLDEPSLRDQDHPWAPYAKGFVSGIAQDTLDTATSPMGAVLSGIGAAKGLRKGYQGLMNVGEAAPGEIAKDVYGVGEGPMGRRQLLYRATNLPKMAAEQRAAQSPNILAQVVSKLDQEMPIKERGKVLGQLEEEAKMLDVLHAKHGVLNKNLGDQSNYWESATLHEGRVGGVDEDDLVPRLSDESFLSSGLDAGRYGYGDTVSGINNQVAELFNKIGPGSRRKYQGSLARISRAVPQKRLVEGELDEGRAVRSFEPVTTDPQKYLDEAFAAYDQGMKRIKSALQTPDSEMFRYHDPRDRERLIESNQKFWDDRKKREAEKLLDTASQIGGPFGEMAKVLVQAKLAPQQIAADAGEAIARGVTRGILSRFGVNPDALEKTEDVVAAGQRVVKEAAPDKIIQDYVKSLLGRFGIKK